jgi:hypothetical protein
MRVRITVFLPDNSHCYTAAIETRDPRQVMNELRKGRKVIGIVNKSRVGLEGDKNDFAVGSETDTLAWLVKRFKEAANGSG